LLRGRVAHLTCVEVDAQLAERLRHQGEAGGYGDKEVASDNAVRMVSEERGPPLVAQSTWAWLVLNVRADRARGEPNLEFQREFVCNSLFAPGRILGCHAADQAPDLR